LFGGELSELLSGRASPAVLPPGVEGGSSSAAPRASREAVGGGTTTPTRARSDVREFGSALERGAGSAIDGAVGPDRVWNGPRDGAGAGEGRHSFVDGGPASGAALRGRSPALPEPQWPTRDHQPPPGGGAPAVRGPGASGMPGGNRPAAGPTPGVAPAGRLAESVSRYWAAAAAASPATGDGVLPGAGPPPAVPHAREPAPRDAELRPQAQADIERALHAFADGRPYVPVHAASAWGAPGPVVNGAGKAVADTLARRAAAADPVHGPQPGAELPARRPGRSGPAEQRSRSAALRDLADDVGEILREQALRHGIDVR
jgi:hypothetical protein